MESPEEIRQFRETIRDDVSYKPIQSPVKRFRYFWKDKEGKELTFKEFMSRWKDGIEGITPLQQIKGQLNATYIMLIGISAGFVITLFAFKDLWWLSIILGAALFNTLIQGLGMWQKKKIYDRMEHGI